MPVNTPVPAFIRDTSSQAAVSVDRIARDRVRAERNRYTGLLERLDQLEAQLEWLKRRLTETK